MIRMLYQFNHRLEKKGMAHSLRLITAFVAWTLSACSVATMAQEVKEHPAISAPEPTLQKAELSPGENTAVRVYQEALPSVVTIYTRGIAITAEGPLLGQGIGSGVLISPECHVLTAAHVVDGADEILVKTQDGRRRPAQVLYSEETADIALVQLLEPDDTLPHAELGDSSKLSVGQWTFVIGSPNGLENSFSAGHISAFRNFGELYDGKILARFVQTDAAINSGNSGGPVFDSRGRVIAITSRIYSRSGGSEGLGFAVAINTAKELLSLDGRTWTGIQGVFLDGGMLRDLFQIDVAGALLVQRVVPGSPAAVAGLRGGKVSATVADREFLLGGDLVLVIDGSEACDSLCLIQAHEQLAQGDVVKVTFLRGGTRHEALLDVSRGRSTKVLNR